MTRRVLIPVLAAALAMGSLAAFAYTRLAAPQEVAEPEFNCTTCDARQAAKRRLTETLRSKSD